MKQFLFLVFFYTSLFSSINERSAIVYYGSAISYPMVGVHDYIIVQPELTNTYTHGFSLYKKKMYAYVSIGEIDKKVKEYAGIQKEWIVATNPAWQSEVLDIKNKEYQEYFFKVMVEPRLEQGFENFFIDTLDSYHLASETKEEKAIYEKELAEFINEFHKRYPDVKLIVNRGFEIIDSIHESVEAVLFESYYTGLSGENLEYAEISDEAREWLDIQIDKIKSYGLDVISVDYLAESKITQAQSIANKLKRKGLIPYVSNRELNIYGKSSKNAIKREILTIIDTSEVDKIEASAHRQGGLVLEYLGYVQKLYDIHDGLPKIESLSQYSGVIIWLSEYYDKPYKLVKWIKQVSKTGLKVVIVDDFGIETSSANALLELGIELKQARKVKDKIIALDEMMSYEVNPPLSYSFQVIKSKNIRPLLMYENRDGSTSTPAAITEWGAYAVGESFMFLINKENIWVVDPFKFFKEALDLKSLIVPDVTTQNGKRLLFTHIDGDGIMNRVEGNSEHFSGEIILEEILKKYDIPHSVSVIGGEINPEGLFPELSPKLIQIAKDMFALDNVEAATHTYTHPFLWGMIVDDTLDPQYRLKVKDYNFSIEREILQSIEDINNELLPSGHKKVKTVFWSGDCAPRVDALEHTYQNEVLNINGGDTFISKTKPWLSYVAPLGLQRGEYYQVYTGAQNENVYTNDWLGPFWGFKKVVQTFEMTNSPRRFKPIDIYYHLYSGSKMASLKALHYVFDWALQQDTMPIFTSEYIPKVMDYYTVSMAQEGDEWLVEGMRDLKTLRIEKENAGIDLKNSKSTLGLKHFENHTYISLDTNTQHRIKVSNNEEYKKETYLISSNAKLVDYKNGVSNKQYIFDGHVDLKLSFNLPKECKLNSKPKATKVKKSDTIYDYEYNGVRGAKVEIVCN